jgi:hypothetical protein
MKKYIFLFFTVCFSETEYAQVIQITCYDTQTYTKSGWVKDPNKILTAPDHKTDVTPADCYYTLDLDEMTSTFFSRTRGNIGSTISIKKVIRRGSVFELDLIDHDTSNPENTIPVKMFIDIDKETFEYLYYDKFNNSTTVYPTGKITMTINHIL